MNHIILPRNREDAGRAVRFLESLDKSKPWLVEAREYKPRRSEEQNRYLWSIYRAILKGGGETLGGWTAEDLHEHYKSRFFGTETLWLAGHSYERALQGSSRLNKQEMSDYIAFVQREAANLGIKVPDPDEYLAEAT